MKHRVQSNRFYRPYNSWHESPEALRAYVYRAAMDEKLHKNCKYLFIEEFTMCWGEYSELPSPSRKAALCKSSLAMSGSANPAISIFMRSGQNSAISHGLKDGQSTIEVKHSMTEEEHEFINT